MSEHDLTPEEEAEVTRMLADLPPVQMPESVQARLEDVLAGLVADHSGRDDSGGESGLAEVVPLRRRRWPQVLVAAAAVSLFGYVGGALIQSQSQSDAELSTAGAGDRADDGAGALQEDSKGLQPAAPSATSRDADKPRVTTDQTYSQSLRGLSDVVNLAAALNREINGTGSYLPAEGMMELTRNKADLRSYRVAAKGCDVPSMSASDRAYDVRISKKRAVVVVLHKVTANAARADVYPCKRPFLPVGSTFVLGVR